MTPWVGRLLVANALMFLLALGNYEIGYRLAFSSDRLLAAPWTLITYAFLHGSFGHLFFNMLALYFFGPRVEIRLGSGRFIAMYVFSALVGALLHAMFSRRIPMVGASAAVFGVQYVFARFWPREPIYLYGVIRLEAWTLVILMTFLSLLMGSTPGLAGGIAHFAHLGGFLGGFLFLAWTDRTSDAAKWRAKVAPPPPPAPLLDVERWKKANLAAMHPVNREEYERVLAKLDTAGLKGLSHGEIEFLERFSRLTTT
jgi:membrane associated rhomboid family serine protease